jgi:hypothetical protein
MSIDEPSIEAEVQERWSEAQSAGQGVWSSWLFKFVRYSTPATAPPECLPVIRVMNTEDQLGPLIIQVLLCNQGDVNCSGSDPKANRGALNYPVQSFNANQSIEKWGPLPPQDGNYTVKVGVFTHQWVNLYWNDNVASFSSPGACPYPGN